ncbi:hypothetical protein H6781_02425 [Candidatus Nomurabacteria bacterium]|nr:hypothetical protein [Candidatus Kaiserbacteria bacterium]MCB9810426.1 hypothetical protein [Candidatus Nomurabacteria bacterium]MCB9817991.1 hypothetical protein [Candidatus Nomurabacteria bacterium]
MINLIPPSAKKDLKREYWVRVIAVWLLLWSVFLVVGACLLFPVYVLIGSQVAVYKDSAEEASQRVTSYENVTTTLVQASLQAKFVLDEIAVPVFSEQIELFETLEGSEIKINKIYIGRGADGIAPISLSGIASGRQALASFRDRILNLENVEDVDLPISNLAQDKNIPFTIKVTLINQKEV